MISEPVRAFKLDRASLHWLGRRSEEPDRSGYEVRRPTVSAALWVAALAGFAALGALRGSWSSTWGDEGTYLAMAESLVLDGDLVFGERDLKRLAGEATAARSTLILQRNERGITYSKPVLYAVLVAPFFRLFGELGPIVFNVLLLALALRLVLAYLRRLGSAELASFTLVTFAGASILLPYVVWILSDLLLAAPARPVY